MLEQLLCFTTIHEDCLCTEHLWHLGQDAGSTLCHQPVRELADQWVGGDAAETVRATTLQTNAQLRYADILALVLLGLSVELAQNLHASLHLVAFYALGHQQLDAVFVIVAEHGHEVFRLVVLAA